MLITSSRSLLYMIQNHSTFFIISGIPHFFQGKPFMFPIRNSFDQKIILIAGGYDKKIPYEPLAPEIVAHVKVLVLMGATAPRIEKAVREDPNFDPQALPILHADSMQHAVELARGAAKPGDIVSLSPASASFDLYPNFEVRGRDYKRIVNELQ